MTPERTDWSVFCEKHGISILYKEIRANPHAPTAGGRHYQIALYRPIASSPCTMIGFMHLTLPAGTRKAPTVEDAVQAIIKVRHHVSRMTVIRPEEARTRPPHIENVVRRVASLADSFFTEEMLIEGLEVLEAEAHHG